MDITVADSVYLCIDFGLILFAVMFYRFILQQKISALSILSITFELGLN